MIPNPTTENRDQNGWFKSACGYEAKQSQEVKVVD